MPLMHPSPLSVFIGVMSLNHPRGWGQNLEGHRKILEHNSFSGNLPATLGNLPRIEKLLLNSNNVIGELPETFARLTTLKIFRIGDNNFTGKIPSFIFQNWKKLEDM
ncbi:hypothetical protein Goklo_025847 [Gossypium klotzschianum]|uniref:Uncharacterized protein n=1 Tax=Gossypium klotzschianum TaxID=34286 RepID=A0A7J8TSV5_9ROSI|nr:hypothetical protein [Gossypium klotzschianum]